MALSIPTDPVEIEKELQDLLAQTPETTDRGRLFHLIKAAMGSGGGGGGGLPLSKEGLMTAYSDEPTSFDHNVYFYNAEVAYYAEEGAAPCNGYVYTRGQVFRKPIAFEVNGDNTNRIYLGATSVTKSEDGMLELLLDATASSGASITRRWFKDVSATPWDQIAFAAVDGLQQEYDAFDKRLYVVTAQWTSTTTATLILNKATPDGKLTPVGEPTVISFSCTANDFKKTTISVCEAGEDGYVAIVLFNQFADRTAVLTMDTATGVATTVLDNITAGGVHSYASAQTIRSYNLSAAGYLVCTNDTDTFGNVKYTLFKFSAGVSTQVGTLECSDVFAASLQPSIAAEYKDGVDFDYHFRIVSPHKRADSVIDTWIWDADGDNSLTHAPIDLKMSLGLGEFYETGQAGFISEQDANTPFESGFLILKSKVSNHYGLFGIKSGKICGALPAPKDSSGMVACTSIDDYAIMYENTTNGDVKAFCLGQWAYDATPAYGVYTGEPDMTEVINPNVLGAPLMAQPNEISVYDSNYDYGLVLPREGGVINLNSYNITRVPDDAEVGTEWTVMYLKGTNSRAGRSYPERLQYFGSIVCERGEGRGLLTLCTPIEEDGGVGRVSWAYHIKKTDTGYTVDKLV
ncbi:hypothetical protein [Vibrio phage vB_VpS_PG28]|nr:hypothetical protein [Vibrio phage vB_VpS_PG28]